MEIAVSPEDNVEVRRITLTNLTAAPRELEVTSYAEIVLAPAAADAAHPAFSNLFVETEFVRRARRPCSRRAARARPRRSAPWALHVIAVRGHATSVTEYETDRAVFVGRGRTAADPLALHAPLGGSDRRGAGSDLQPAPARADRARRHGADHLHHWRRR